MVSKPEQFLKASSRIAVMLSGNVTERTSLRPKNA